jgi:hypothetical protein
VLPIPSIEGRMRLGDEKYNKAHCLEIVINVSVRSLVAQNPYVYS